jgi:hypothetical protein
MLRDQCRINAEQITTHARTSSKQKSINREPEEVIERYRIVKEVLTYKKSAESGIRN